MKVTYDQATDSLTIVLKDGVPVTESDEGRGGVVLDYDAHGGLVSVEILEASQHVTDARRIEYEAIEPEG